ncbi:hypothetical protein U1Q18_045404 [Sarracenia purpurea var. burkii]
MDTVYGLTSDDMGNGWSEVQSRPPIVPEGGTQRSQWNGKDAAKRPVKMLRAQRGFFFVAEMGFEAISGVEMRLDGVCGVSESLIFCIRMRGFDGVWK